MRYDPIGQKFEPKLAQSLEASSDSKTWTLKLRDGVKFSDGTALDSKAVADSINRYVTNKGPQSSLWASKVASIDTPDATTVVFNLVDPWTGIQSMLATGPGMIVAPSAQQGDQFTPIAPAPSPSRSSLPTRNCCWLLAPTTTTAHRTSTSSS